MPKHKFTKAERLYKKLDIEALFLSKRSFSAYPYRVVYSLRANADKTNTPSAALLISVSKKRFKNAVDRNHIKRLTREAYRLNKEPLIGILTERNLVLHFALIAICDELPSSACCQKAMKRITKLLSKESHAYGQSQE